jgi:hypothetical protein
MHPRDADPARLGQSVQSAGGGVAVHPGSAGRAQDRSGVTAGDGSVDGKGYVSRSEGSTGTITPETAGTRSRLSIPQ